MLCPPIDVVQRFKDNTSPEPERLAFGEHLADCSSCLKRVTELHEAGVSPTHDVGPQPPQHESSSKEMRSEPAKVLARGTLIGRYVVLDLLGSGGMGEVYTAFDPELDRKVAVKVVKSDASYGDKQNETRLFREAQAMAKLAHPNVVPVYDVGLVEDRVFLAMELVSGTTVKVWTRTGERSWREILRVYRAAGEGLAAAHRVGLIHRDCKPENVLIGDDGRVRVLDFGLAKSDPRERAPKPAAGDLQTQSLLDANITQAASVLGTPSYMAPERLNGGTEDARTDQFSFCVSLYEGLYGEKPFTGDSTERVVASILQGTIRSPSDSRDVPRWLRRIVLRGLSHDPAARYPSMEALLADLGRDVEGKRRRGAVALALGLLAVAGGFGGWRALSARAALCRGFETHLAGVWDGKVRDSTREVFQRVGGAVGLETHHRAERVFDQWASDWLATRTSVCEATRLRGEQTEAVMSLRIACLDQALVNAKAASSLFATADQAAVVKAVDVVSALPRLDACANTAKLLLMGPPETDPAVLAKLDEVRARVAEAAVAFSAGQYERARTLADQALATARTLKHRTLIAEAALVLARAIERLGDVKLALTSYVAAVTTAYEAGSDELTARSAARLAYTIGYLLGQGDEAQRWLAVAMSALERAGHPEIEEAEVLDQAGIVEVAAGRGPAAHQLIERAVALRKHALGAQHVETVRAMNHLAFTLTLIGKGDEALAMQKQILEIETAVLGAQHPDVAGVLLSIGSTHFAAGHAADALPYYQQGLAVLEAALGPDHPDLVIPLNNVGAALSSLERVDEALALQRRALAMKEKAFGAEHASVGVILGNIAHSLGRLGKFDEALTTMHRAVAITDKANGPLHSTTAAVLRQLALIYLQAKRPRDALEPFERALKISTQADVQPGILGSLQLEYVRTLIEVGERARARKAFEGYRASLEAAGFEKDCATLAREFARR